MAITEHKTDPGFVAKLWRANIRDESPPGRGLYMFSCKECGKLWTARRALDGGLIGRWWACPRGCNLLAFAITNN